MSAINVFKNILIWFLLLIILPLPIILLFIYKNLVTLVAKCKYSNLIPFAMSDTMANGDSVYTKPLLNVGFILKINGLINLTELRALVKKELLDPRQSASADSGEPLNRNLFCYIERFGGYHFKRQVSEIDIDEFITEVVIAKKTDTQSEDEVLSELITDYYYSPHKYGKPLWGIKIIRYDKENGDTNPEQQKSLLLFRIHHSMADGYSIIYLFDKLTGNEAPILTTPFNETLWEKIKVIASGPTTFLNFINSSSKVANPVPSSGINTKVFYSLITLDLAKVKTVRKQTGGGTTHVLSILLTILGSTLRRIILRTCNEDEDRLSPHMYIASSLAWPNHPRNQMCNEWTVGAFKVPLRNPNSLERLQETEADHVQFFEAGVDKVLKRLLVPFMSLFPVCLGEKMIEVDPPTSCSWAAIVAGNNYKLLNCSIEHIFPVVGYTHPKMTWVTISMSHSNKIDVTVAVNQEFISSFDYLNQDISRMLDEELNKLVEAVSSKKDD